MPIVSTRLRAAIRINGVSEKKLATAIGVSQQRLNRFARGEGKRCRQSMRDALAERLGVNPDWLGGELKWLPFASYFEGADPDALALSQLVEARFTNTFEKAFRRDMRREYPDSDVEVAKYKEWGWIAVASIPELTDPQGWRNLLLRWEGDLPWRLTPDLDDATEALAKAFMIILEPWLKDRASLDMRGLVNLFHLFDKKEPVEKKRTSKKKSVKKTARQKAAKK